MGKGLYPWLWWEGAFWGREPVRDSPIPTPFLQTNGWRLSTVNKDFSVCASYPPVSVVPRGIGDEVLARSARFRQGGRFPVLCYYHSINGTVSVETASGPPLCSQPQTLLITRS